jgi:chromosome partitioning protein
LEILAVYNIKGGVGKTTTCVNLAYLSAAAGWRTVLWDLDPQAAASYLLDDDDRVGGSMKRLIKGSRELPDVAKGTRFSNLDLIPADRSYREMDLQLAKRKKPAQRLIKMMRPLAASYAAMFLDCPPGLSLVSENVFRAADALIVPVLPTPLSERMLEELVDYVCRERRDDLLLLPFFSMVDRRRALHRDMVAALRERFPSLLTTEIPYSSEIERLTLRRQPLPAYAPRSAGAEAFGSLWGEVDARLQSRFDRGHVR